MKTFLGMEIEQSNRSIKLHLDHYIREMLNEYKVYIKKSLRSKRVPFSPGVILRPEDSPTLPDPSKQKFYRSFVAKLQFAASWIRFDIPFAVSQLARFCASAGSTHWAALHHLMEYIEGLPSFKITYRRRVTHNQDLLSGYADSDWGNSSSRRSTSGMIWEPDALQPGSNHVALKDAENHGSVHGRGGVLLSINGRQCRAIPPQAPRTTRLRLLHQCMRTTRRASSGETTSSVGGNAPSTSTSGSTSPTSRMARCGLSESLPHPSWQTSSRRASTTRSGRRASRASSARRSEPLKGPRSSRGDGSPRLTSRVTSPLKRGVST